MRIIEYREITPEEYLITIYKESMDRISKYRVNINRVRQISRAVESLFSTHEHSIVRSDVGTIMVTIWH